MSSGTCDTGKGGVKKERLRQQYLFWLDMTKPNDVELAAKIAELKACRKFVQTIRDGIRLMEDLRVGRLDVLLALFPSVTEHLQSPLYANELATVLERFQQVAINGPVNASPFPQPNILAVPEVKTIFNETEAIQRSVINTLASLDDF